MIRMRDTLLLAGTKLRTRRVRTGITMLLSSVLFAAIVAALVLSNGALKSLDDFNGRGLNSRYLVHASADPRLAGGVLSDKDLLSLARQDYKDLVAKKTAEAKKLGVPYDPMSEPEAVITHTSPGGLSSHELLSINSPAAQQAIREYIHTHPGPGMDELKKIARSYHPTAFYINTPAMLFDGTIQTMKGGKENFSNGKDFFYDTTVTEMSGKLADPFIEQGVHLGKGNVPLVISYTRAEKLLGLDTLPKSASVHDQYERIQKLYGALRTDKMTITTCYRNGVSEDQITTALAQTTDKKIAQNDAVRYGLPSALSCGAVNVVRDNRPDVEKQQAIAQLQFDTEFSTQAQTPEQQKITFQVVGLYSDIVANSNNLSLFGLLSSVTGSSLNGGDVIPENMFTQTNSVAKKVLFDGKNKFGDTRPSYTLEFASAQDAKQFIHDKSCTTRMSGTCASPGKPFNLTAYGNNSIALGNISKKVSKLIAMAAIIVAIFAAVIMSTMVGRMIVDGRKESAVYRALGAKRSDIAAIYCMYAFVLTLGIAVLSCAGGIVAARVISGAVGTSATEQARLLFGAVDSNIQLDLFRIDYLQIAAVVAVILLVGCVSTIVPLLRNIRRNPIDDLREE